MRYKHAIELPLMLKIYIPSKFRKIQVTIFSIVLFITAIPTHGRAQILTKASSVEDLKTEDEFLKSLNLKEASLITASGSIKGPAENQQMMDKYLYPRLKNQKVGYYFLDYGKAVKPDPKHEIVFSDRASSLIGFVHIRDYEQDEIDQDHKGSKDVDTVHVLAVSSRQLDSELQRFFKSYVTTMEAGSTQLYAKRQFLIRDELLKIFKTNTTEDSHKMVKGPFDYYLKYWGWNIYKITETEFGSLEKGGIQFLSYGEKGCAFLDLTKTQKDDDIYVLFYAGDGTSDIHGDKYKKEGELDDWMGMLVIPANVLQTYNQSFAYYQLDPTRPDDQ